MRITMGNFAQCFLEKVIFCCAVGTFLEGFFCYELFFYGPVFMAELEHTSGEKAFGVNP